MTRLQMTFGTALALAGSLAASAVLADNPTVGGAAMFEDRNIVENAVNSPIHTTLVAAVTEAGLAETLMGEGPFTVFAPTDEAFAALPEGSVAALLEPGNRDRLVEILTCHVVGAEAFASTITGMIADGGGMHQVETLGGCILTAEVQNGMVTLTDEQNRTATVTVADVDQSNGVIHVIDTVVLPGV